MKKTGLCTAARAGEGKEIAATRVMDRGRVGRPSGMWAPTFIPGGPPCDLATVLQAAAATWRGYADLSDAGRSNVDMLVLALSFCEPAAQEEALGQLEMSIAAGFRAVSPHEMVGIALARAMVAAIRDRLQRTHAPSHT